MKATAIYLGEKLNDLEDMLFAACALSRCDPLCSQKNLLTAICLLAGKQVDYYDKGDLVTLELIDGKPERIQKDDNNLFLMDGWIKSFNLNYKYEEQNTITLEIEGSLTSITNTLMVIKNLFELDIEYIIDDKDEVHEYFGENKLFKPFDIFLEDNKKVCRIPEEELLDCIESTLMQYEDTKPFLGTLSQLRKLNNKYKEWSFAKKMCEKFALTDRLLIIERYEKRTI